MKNSKRLVMIMAVFSMMVLTACGNMVHGDVKDKADGIQEKSEADDESAVKINLSEYTDTVTIDREGTYILSGNLKGQVLVEAEDAAVTLVLDNVDITSPSNAAIYVKKADEVTITLADKSSNVLTDAAEYVYDDEEKEEPNAALFSKSDLTINGTGSLTVNGRFNNAVKTKDILTVVNGEINITAVNDGLSANDGITIENGNITLDVGDDGIHSEEDLIISGGNVTVANSYEGLEGKNVYIEGGNIFVTASDDGINAAGGSDEQAAGGRNSMGEGSDTNVYINGGTVLVHADGDGIDSNGSIYMTGGVVTVFGPTDDGNGAIDYETGMTLSGGTLIAAGSSQMACAPTLTENQSFIMVNINGSEGEEVVVTDSNQTEIIRFTAQKNFSNLVVSTADMAEGGHYYVSAAGTEKECVAGESQRGFGHGGNMDGNFFPGEKPDGDLFPEEKPDGDFKPGEKPDGDFHPGELKPDEMGTFPGVKE